MSLKCILSKNSYSLGNNYADLKTSFVSVCSAQKNKIYIYNQGIYSPEKYEKLWEVFAWYYETQTEKYSINYVAFCLQI